MTEELLLTTEQALLAIAILTPILICLIRKPVEIGCTGIDLTYCDERQGLQFASRAVAIHVAKALSAYGNF